MKKTAILLYPQFCNFEIAPALEILSLAGKPITVFGKSTAPLKSEEGLTLIPEQTIDTLDSNEYDSLLLPGAMDIREVIEDECILSFIRQFAEKAIGAISIAPLLLLKAGLLHGKPFMAGVNQDELMEEGFNTEQLRLMHGWDDCIRHPVPDGYIRSDNIITSVSYHFIPWALAFGEMLGIRIPAKTFGV